MSEYLQSELPAIELFKKLNYDYFDAKGEMYEVVLEDKLEILRAKKEKYQTLKKGLLQKLLSGEVRTV